ncbi:unnamed protein product [Ranitomeya imitator]|uniref:Uncharacterized protein n=1 Tax=Ranitomeya imitator TaxID=111125 RepID=A0ABN9M5S7_9NEOB|nr:unnamed protein product [Ranitomeya imitator]
MESVRAGGLVRPRPWWHLTDAEPRVGLGRSLDACGGVEGASEDTGHTGVCVKMLHVVEETFIYRIIPPKSLLSAEMVTEEGSEWLLSLLRELQLEQFYAKIRDELNMFSARSPDSPDCPAFPDHVTSPSILCCSPGGSGLLPEVSDQ